MSTPVDICNLALARLGDEANVQSISPPDGSTQAALCAQFYPIARDTALTMRRGRLPRCGRRWRCWWVMPITRRGPTPTPSRISAWAC